MGKTGQTPAHDGCTTLPLTLQSAKHLQEQRSYHECDVSSTSFDSITFPEVRLSRHSGFRSFAIFPHVRPIRRGLASRASSVRHFTEAATGECRVEREPARAGVIAQRCSMTARQLWFGTARYEAPRQHNRTTGQRATECHYAPPLQRLWIFSETETAALAIFIGAMFCSASTSWGQHMQSKMWRDEMRNAKCECKRWPCRSQQPWKLPS